MPHRSALSRRLATLTAVAACATCLTGCGTSVDVTPPSPTGAAVAQCRDLLDVLPSELAGSGSNDVRPEGSMAAAWGDPAIVLRCGVPRPTSLTRSSACFVVSGVGWYAEVDGHEFSGQAATDQPVTFTAIDRSTYVEVTVPAEQQPAGSVLAGLADAVTRATRPGRACR